MSEASDIRDLAVVLGRLSPDVRAELRHYAAGEPFTVENFIWLAHLDPSGYYAELCRKLGPAGCRAAVEKKRPLSEP